MVFAKFPGFGFLYLCLNMFLVFCSFYGFCELLGFLFVFV